MQLPSIALVISTYNNPKSLGLCLKSLTNQTEMGFDVYIADDGSKPETKSKIDSFRRFFKNGIQHLWHEDRGYQKAKINNQVFSHLKPYPITICIDHDVILHHRFIEDHKSEHQGETKLLFMGRRVELGPKISSVLTEANLHRFNHGLSLELFKSGWSGDSKNVLRALRVSSPFFRNLLGRDRVPDLLGSNFSVSTSLLFEVNGYDEDYQSYWGEDGDLFIRIRNTGAKIRGSKSIAIQYHLDHPRLEPNPESQARYLQKLNDRMTQRCKNGILKSNTMP